MKRILIPLPNSAFRLGLLLMMVKTVTAFSGIVPYSDLADDILSLLGAGCLGIALLKKPYSPKELIACGLLLFLTLISVRKTGTWTMVLTVLTCMAFRREDFDKSLRFLLSWEGLYGALHMAAALVLSCMGESMVTRVSGEARYNFGFTHPNVFSVLLVNLLSMWAWLNYDRLRPRHLVAMLGISGFFYLFTGSRSAMLVVLAMDVLILLRPHERLLRCGGAVAVSAAALTEYALWRGFAGGSSFCAAVDKVLSGRIRLGAYALDTFGISLLGQELQGVTVVWDEFWRLGSFTFDDIYSYLAVNHGLVWLLLLTVLFCRTARKSGKRGAFILLWALYGAAEMHVLNPYLFFPILLAVPGEGDDG